MPAKNVVPRGARIPLPPRHWWPTAAREAAERRADDLGIRRPGTRSLVEALADEGVKVDEDTVARCLKGTIVTWDVAIPLSRILKVPPPASIAATPDDARAMESTDELRVIMKAIDKIRRDDE